MTYRSHGVTLKPSAKKVVHCRNLPTNWEENLNKWLGKASKEFILTGKRMSVFNKITVSTAVAIGFLATGCKRETVTSYEVPKEDYSVKPLSMAGMGRPGPGGAEEETAQPQLKWTLPPGWKEK